MAKDEITDAGQDTLRARHISEKTTTTTTHETDLHRIHDAEPLSNTGLLEVKADVAYVADRIDTLSVDEAREILLTMLRDHEYDYNFSSALRAQITRLLAGPSEKDPSDADWSLEIRTTAALNRFYSPYPEVRAIATPEDDPSTPCETIRAHLLGLSWAIIGQFTNALFISRFPTISITAPVIQILLYPCGLLLALVLPDWGFTFRKKRISLNPGPWTYKEQMLATTMVNVSINSAYCFWNIQTQQVYYHDGWLTAEYGILLLLSTQLMGMGFAGVLRRFVVYPVEALWPTLLPTVALNRALLMPEAKGTVHGWRLTRYQAFFVFFGGMFAYYWIPGYVFPALSTFAWMTWIAPDNYFLNLITGKPPTSHSHFPGHHVGQAINLYADLSGFSGLGLNPIPTFDWNIITSAGDPLALPLFSITQQFLGQVVGGCVVLALYFRNVSWTAYLPMNAPGIFDNTAAPYNITRVLDPERAVVLEDKYKAYSPPFYSAGGLLTYAVVFILYPLTMVFVVLDAWRPILKGFRLLFATARDSAKSFAVGVSRAVRSLTEGEFKQAFRHIYAISHSGRSVYDGFDDPFTQMMRRYPEVPDSWFLFLLAASLAFALAVLLRFPQLGAPVWTIFFVLGVNAVFLVPMTYVNSIAGVTVGLNVATELVAGYALPGRPEALMFIKAFGYNIGGQADNYISDQKLGFYAKVPPRAMYRGQVLATVVTAFVCYGVVTFVDNNIPDICTPHQKSKFTCAGGSLVFYSSSVVWVCIRVPVSAHPFTLVHLADLCANHDCRAPLDRSECFRKCIPLYSTASSSDSVCLLYGGVSNGTAPTPAMYSAARSQPPSLHHSTCYYSRPFPT